MKQIINQSYLEQITNFDYFIINVSQEIYFWLYQLLIKDMQDTEGLPHVLFNEEVPNSKQEGFTSIYRKKGSTKLSETPDESIKTLRELLKASKASYGNKNAIGQIQLTKEVNEEGKQVQKRTVVQHTYDEAYDASLNLGRYLYEKGLYLTESTQNMKLVGIYSKNRYEWFLADWAFSLFGLTAVPLYDTLGIENLTYCLNQTDITTLFVTATTVKILLELKEVGKLKTIISFDHLDQQTAALLKEAKLELLDFWEVVKQGSTLNANNNEIVINSDDCSTFSYTSGTTGPPKGAMVSHKNILSCLAGFNDHPDLKFNSTDRYLSYLPLPHLMERSLVWYVFYTGGNIIVSSGNNLKLKEDCEAAKITLFISVPRVFSRIAEAIKNKFIEMKLPTFHHPAIFEKVRQSFGGHIRFIATGSAPINIQVLNYLRDVFQCTFIEGYGQTENTAGHILARSCDKVQGNISEISSGYEIKLRDIPEMKYTSKDVDQHGRPSPRGQLWSRGPPIFKGYYKQPGLTKQTVTEDGWLKSGDVVEINPQNNGIKIIDRVKNIFKLSQGEYLAPDRIENVYTRCNLISQAYLHGDSLSHYAVAIITPNREILEQIAEKNEIKGSYQQICSNPQIKKIVLGEINKIGKGQGLNGFEIAKNIHLETKGFIYKGILTNTLKLIRYEARKVYKNEIQKLYEEGQISLK